MSEGLPITRPNLATSGSVLNVAPVPGVAAFNVLLNSVSQISVVPTTSNGTTITLGANSVPTEVFINGGIRFKPTIVNGTSTLYLVADNEYYVKITSPTYRTVLIPPALTRGGKEYIISRKFTSLNSLKVIASGSDTFDGYPDVTLDDDTALRIISDGLSGWDTV